MRPPAEIALWLSTEDMQAWVREASEQPIVKEQKALDRA